MHYGLPGSLCQGHSSACLQFVCCGVLVCFLHAHSCEQGVVVERGWMSSSLQDQAGSPVWSRADCVCRVFRLAIPSACLAARNGVLGDVVCARSPWARRRAQMDQHADEVVPTAHEGKDSQRRQSWLDERKHCLQQMVKHEQPSMRETSSSSLGMVMKNCRSGNAPNHSGLSGSAAKVGLPVRPGLANTVRGGKDTRQPSGTPIQR